jgi:hypothetical protein
MPSFSEWLFGSPEKLKKVPTGTEQQQQFGGHDLISMLQQMMQVGGGQNLANQHDKNLLGQGPEAFNQFSAPYLQQFQEQMIPEIAERFAKNGALSSSGFGQALGGASSNLQAQLAQLFSQLQGQAAGRQQGQFQNLSQLGLNYQPFAYNQKQGSQGFLGPALGVLGNSFLGPMGGTGLGQLGTGISSLFKGSGGGLS